jgi:hypothetical protein
MSADPASAGPASPAATGAGRHPVCGEAGVGRETFPMAPLIRLTLLLLYVALVLPLPLMAPDALRPLLLVAVPSGLVLVLALTSERVELDHEGLRVGHPAWCSWWLRRGWSLRWEQVASLTPVGTSQGGRVFYVRTRDNQGAHLLPQRVARFEQFRRRFAELSGLDCSAVVRLTPPWTYQLLALLSGLLLGGELLLLPMALPLLRA